MINNGAQRLGYQQVKKKKMLDLVWIQSHSPEQVRPPSSGLKGDVVLISHCFEERLTGLSNKGVEIFWRLVNGMN